MKVHLTDITVRTLRQTGANKTYQDDATPGFGVRVGSSSMGIAA
jgi:hypothetical protein